MADAMQPTVDTAQAQFEAASELVERIVVQRRPHPLIVTDVVACVGCKTMTTPMSSSPEPTESPG